MFLKLLFQYFKVKNSNKLMLFLVFWKVIKWVEYCFSICYFVVAKSYSEKQVTYGTVFGAISRYWEQTLTIFDDVLFKETAHAQLGHHTRKSRMAWKTVPWKKCHSRQLWVAFWIFHSIRHRYANNFLEIWKRYWGNGDLS